MLLSRLSLAALAFAALSAVASASPAPVIVSPEAATWKAVPGFKGFEMAPIVGDPSKAGAYYAYFLKASDGAKAPPHYHRMTENVVVVSGTFLVGIGDTMNVATMKALAPGTVVSVPAGVRHYAMAKGPIVIEVSGIGPDTTTLVH
jgi:uncharacterized RmlC-like cupin family protein